MAAVVCGTYEDEDTLPLQRLCEPRRALFLDRDGIINIDRGYVHRADDTQWIEGIFDLCRVAVDAGCLVVVVTNQAGIARGYYSEREFLVYTRWVHAQFKSHGITLHATCYCPHHPDAIVPSARVCQCRKPAPGMLLEAARRYGISLGESALLGDKPWDVEAGLAAGVGLNLRYETDGKSASNAVGSMDEAGVVLQRYFGMRMGVDDVRT